MAILEKKKKLLHNFSIHDDVIRESESDFIEKKTERKRKKMFVSLYIDSGDIIYLIKTNI